jgi:hypothetical protein
MNNNNSEVNGMVFALALVGVFLLFAAIFVGVILALYSLFLTGVCFWAWNEPRTIFKETIKPSEARCFVYSGIVGAFTSPFAVAIVAQMANVRIDDDYIFLILLGGYTIGSLLSAWIMHLAEEHEKANASEMIDVTPSIPASRSKPSNDNGDDGQGSFEFATWDDEEKR